MWNMKMLEDQNGNVVYDVGNGHIYKNIYDIVDDSYVELHKIKDKIYPIMHYDKEKKDFVDNRENDYYNRERDGKIIHLIEVGYLGDFVKQSLER